MPILLLLTLSWSVALASALLCDITKTFRTLGYEGKYFSLETNNTCYVFSLRKVHAQEAQRFCRSIGGSLTDVESGTENLLQKVLAVEKKNTSDLDTSFWIGLMWNYYVGYWYWDNGVTQVLREANSGPGRTFLRLKPCVSLTAKELVECKCGEEHAFICKIDIPYLKCGASSGTSDQDSQLTNSSSCTPQCVEYIIAQKSQAVATTPTTATTPWWDITTNGEDGVTNITANGTASRTCAHDTFLADCQTTADYQRVLIASLGALAAVFFVMSIVMCAKLIQYRRMLSEKDSPTRISMVDILHADSPSTARRKRADNHNTSHPGSTSELLGNPYNTYATPDTEGGQAAESPDFIYQENGYSSVAEPSRSGKEAIPGPQPGPVDNEYMLLNRDTDQEGPQNVYGLDSASEAPTDSRKASDPYEAYGNQQ